MVGMAGMEEIVEEVEDDGFAPYVLRRDFVVHEMVKQFSLFIIERSGRELEL